MKFLSQIQLCLPPPTPRGHKHRKFCHRHPTDIFSSSAQNSKSLWPGNLEKGVWSVMAPPLQTHVDGLKLLPTIHCQENFLPGVEIPRQHLICLLFRSWWQTKFNSTKVYPGELMCLRGLPTKHGRGIMDRTVDNPRAAGPYLKVCSQQGRWLLPGCIDGAPMPSLSLYL